ncbi:hypothetical protein C8F01DRAFT_1362793 [Mycena amicta]|nr:hypothetical protein C8F01DRAFT_1362793 [Mycena amicta]
MASPLPPATVATLLHYISPAVQTIPPHLLGKELAFRHSCLNLTGNPEDPSYILWPSDDQERVLDALSAFQQRQLDDVAGFDIRYTVDDALFAHVALTPDLRLVFKFEEDAWKYHNAARMPFPDPASSSPLELPILEETDETSDAYWGSYGDDAQGGPDVPEAKDEEQCESDYWALYQGSADSFVPSPVPEKEVVFTYAKPDPIDSLSDRLETLARRVEEEDAATVVNGETEDGLRETLRGVWRMWRANRKSAGVAADDDFFRRTVDDVLTEGLAESRSHV